MNVLRTTLSRVTLALALGAVAAAGACTLNPQPLPPSDFGGANVPGAAGGGGDDGAPRVAADAGTSGPAGNSTGDDAGVDGAAQFANDSGADASLSVDASDAGDASDAPDEGG